ncbi:hypothetical protein, conserved, partial [Eimeria acervulina]
GSGSRAQGLSLGVETHHGTHLNPSTNTAAAEEGNNTSKRNG